MPEATVSPSDISDLIEQVDRFMEAYYPLFRRVEQKNHARMYVTGRLAHLERRTLEPIASSNGVYRRPLQHFVGAGQWSDDAVRDKICADTSKTLGNAEGVLILDASSFQKWGRESVGVQRQWCGRLGKEENCQVAEYLGYASAKGHVLVDCRIYLPQTWADDALQREKAYVPEAVTFRKGWELGLEMVKGRGSMLPHAWVLGDDAYGRVVELRKQLDVVGERYLLEVPSNTKVRRNSGDEESYRVDELADSFGAKEWKRVRTRDGEKGPIEVCALKMRVTPVANRDGRRETLLLVRSPASGKRWFYLSNAVRVAEETMAKAAACRHYVEQSFAHAKGEVGLAEYEVRSWVGWHHHMTLSLLAMLFLAVEKVRLKKSPAVTVPQVRNVIARLMRLPDATSEQLAEIAADVSRQLRRNEAVRRAHWKKRRRRAPLRMAAKTPWD